MRINVAVIRRPDGQFIAYQPSLDCVVEMVDAAVMSEDGVATLLKTINDVAHERGAVQIKSEFSMMVDTKRWLRLHGYTADCYISNIRVFIDDELLEEDYEHRFRRPAPGSRTAVDTAGS